MTIEEIMRSNLTNDQYDAVIDDAKHILCLACAGSGKSRTLVLQKRQTFKNPQTPLQINTPTGLKTIAALDMKDEGYNE